MSGPEKVMVGVFLATLTLVAIVLGVWLFGLAAVMTGSAVSPTPFPTNLQLPLPPAVP